MSSSILGPGRRGARPFFLAASTVCAALLSGPAISAADLTRVQGILAATPAGGWVQVNTNVFSSAWPTGSTAVSTLYTQGSPASIEKAWAGFAWDSNSGQMLLWGGGHANYAGDEMYSWQASTGLWERESLPSKVLPIPTSINGSYYVVDNAAPVAAHPFDGSIFLPVNNMFINFLGPSWNSGDRGKVYVNGVTSDSGPWMFDPTKGNANLVGGTTGSGYDPSTPGGNMWLNRYGQWTGSEGPYAPYVTTAYRNEAGKDVVYLTMDQGSSHFPLLVRYTVGDVRHGGLDKWETIGVTTNSVIRGGTATIDSRHNLMVRTAFDDSLSDLAIWDLTKSNAANPNLNTDIPIKLTYADGSNFVTSDDMAIEYDSADDMFVIWDGSAKGMVWTTRATYLANGQLKPTWIVSQLNSATAAQPDGNFLTGVYGKWKYIPELNAFMALDEFNDTTTDAGVWLYKPLAVAVPELSTPAMLLLGLGMIGWSLRRRRPS
jgi:hypothetical protein